MKVYYRAQEEVFRMNDTLLRFRNATESTQDSFYEEKGVHTLMWPGEARKMTAQMLADSEQSGQMDASDERRRLCLRRRNVPLLLLWR